MIKYYNNREISNRLCINLARWKRWSREFLPPDPLGGLQSGYARQYSLRETITVALGGHLVGFLKFSVPQARTILADLNPWMARAGYFHWSPPQRPLNGYDLEMEENQCVLIRCPDNWKGEKSDYCYLVTIYPNLINDGGSLAPVIEAGEVIFINTPLEMRKDFGESPFIVLLCIGQFRRYLLQRLHNGIAATI